MSAVAKRLMTVDAFLDFAEPREGRWELEDGVAYSMAPERMAHVRCKFQVILVLSGAIKRAGLPCEALIDGPAVRIGPRTAYQPDGLVYCGGRLPGEAREAPSPVVIVEVLSPSTRSRDEGKKLVAYFSLPSVWHYLVIDPDDHVVVHHQRALDGRIEPRTWRAGALRLDPPGLELDVAELFASQ